MSRTFRIATRQSKLAQVQARAVGDALMATVSGATYELVFITTTGDKSQHTEKPVSNKEDFIREVDQALLDGRADIAVHSMKDVPTQLTDGIILPAMMERADIRDVVVCRKGTEFLALKAGSKVGTSSVRRAAQIRAAFPDLEVVNIRGNVDTRLAKLEAGNVDALILAKAGLDRLDLTSRITDVLEPDMMCPAVGQGAVGMACRADDAASKAALEAINHDETYVCVSTERVLLDALGGNCKTPIAAYVVVTANRNLRLIGLVSSSDGKTVLRVREKMPYDQWHNLGQTCGQMLLDEGAQEIIAATAKLV